MSCTCIGVAAAKKDDDTAPWLALADEAEYHFDNILTCSATPYRSPLPPLPSITGN